MFKSLAAAFIALATFTPVWAADAPAANSGATPQPNTEQVVSQFRNDLQAARADVMAKGLTLTAEQAAKFWPLFEQFQKEQNAIIDSQLAATQKYADNYAKLSDADSLAYVSALLERDEKIHALRVKWLAKFQTVLPAGVAARAIQIDRRLGLVAQIGLSSKIPLVR
jgi:Spy/CpxP family protein refolding chaperone